MAEQNTTNENETLTKFYEDLEKDKLTFKTREKELVDIESSVYKLVRTILNRVAHADDRFKCSDILRVGSYREGTKIIQPDEFDFLAVIDELSNPDAVKAEKVCEKRPGSMHLKVLDENLKVRWKDFIRDDELIGFTYQTAEHVDDETAYCFSNAIAEVFDNDGSSERLGVERETGVMKYEGFNMFHEPNIELLFVWFPKNSEELFKISIDISPAVQCFNVSDAVLEKDCNNPEHYKKLADFGSFLLTPGKVVKDRTKPMKCFRISLTEVEVELVRSLSYLHKQCYRALKYILAYRFKDLSLVDIIYSGLSSYTIKTSVLHHTSRCKEENMYFCMKDVTHLLICHLQRDRPFLPSFPSLFITKHNLFDSLKFYQTSKLSALDLVMHVQCLHTLDFFNERLESIPVHEYSYDKCLGIFQEMVTNLENVKQKIAKFAEIFVTFSGEWGAYDMSTRDMIQKFGIPDFELLCPAASFDATL